MPDINRADALALIQQQEINEIIEGMPAASAALSTFRVINMGTKTARMPVVATLPAAGWVTEEADATGVKPTSEMTWASKMLTAEELAVIVPIHENVFDDSEVDIWAQVRPAITDAIGEALDAAVFFGTNKPASFPEALVPQAIADGNAVAAGAGDIVERINQAWGAVENDGYDVNVQYARRSIRQSLRGLRDTTGSPMFLASLREDGQANSVMGEDLVFAGNGAWDATAAAMLVGDRSKAILGLRQDVTFKLLDQATVNGVNLAERDMIALRAKFRVAFQWANPTTRENGGTGFPFAVVQP